MKVRVISKDSCQPIGTILEVRDEVVYGELTEQPMHEIVGKNENAKYIQSRYFEEVFETCSGTRLFYSKNTPFDNSQESY